MKNSGLKGGITSLGLDRADRLWASSHAGIFYYAHGRFTRVASVPAENTVSISEDDHGNVWILDGHEGLFQADAKGTIRKISALPPISSGQTYWGVLLPERSGNGLWLGSARNGGLLYFKDGQVRSSYSAANGLGAGRVSHLRFGSRGVLWAATESGLSRLQDGHLSTLTSKNGLPCDAVALVRGRR